LTQQAKARENGRIGARRHRGGKEKPIWLDPSKNGHAWGGEYGSVSLHLMADTRIGNHKTNMAGQIFLGA